MGGISSYDWQATRADALEMSVVMKRNSSLAVAPFLDADDEMLKEFVRRLPDFDDVVRKNMPLRPYVSSRH